mmetsp:Transcript_4003/g.8537  ORF Transcript_4003/g.8537 Transcript_4003/m.8537 type:complete len:297 (-) Transcript_4003:411-1301(-)
MPPANQAAGMNDAPGITDWFNSLPPITRYWFGGAAALTLGANFGIVSPYRLIYDFGSIKNSFHVWRLVTSFLYVGPFSINTLMGLYMLYQFSKQYEGGGPYNTGAGGGTADYAFCLLFGIAGCVLMYHGLGGFIPMAPLFTRNLTFYVLYVWGRKNPTVDANIWGVPIKGMYLAFAYLLLNVLLGNPYWDILAGIGLGHVYYFLVDVYPLVYGKDLLHTPRFLIDFFGIGDYVPPVAPAGGYGGVGTGGGTGGGFARPGNVRTPGDPTGGGAAGSSSGGGRSGHNWGGGGRRLGDN